MSDVYLIPKYHPKQPLPGCDANRSDVMTQITTCQPQLSRVGRAENAITGSDPATEIVMAGTLSHKSVIILNAIAITTALAVISGYLPVQSVSIAQLEASLQNHLLQGQK